MYMAIMYKKIYRDNSVFSALIFVSQVDMMLTHTAISFAGRLIAYVHCEEKYRFFPSFRRSS